MDFKEISQRAQAKSPETQASQVNEAQAQRVAEILAGKMQGPRVHGTTIGQPARVVGHQDLRCRNCGIERSADHPGPAGGCGGNHMLSHDFHGFNTVVESVDSLLPHHAIFVDGTVAYPVNA